jgi:hypothetical protein
MKTILFSIFILVVSCVQTSAQNKKIEASTKTSSIEGTYQLQVINSRANPFIPGNLEELVLNNRNATKTVYLSLGTEVRLMILSTEEISKKDFKKISQVAHISE